MKEMVYKYKRETELLDSGVHDGYEYAIVSGGTHPCAYVKLPHGHKYYSVDYDDIPVECHGGLTYSDNKLDVLPLCSGWWIGWDYGHFSDYSGRWLGANLLGLKKWTTVEILAEVKDVIRQLEELHKSVIEAMFLGVPDEKVARSIIFLAKAGSLEE